jgi:hypothetical protein
MRSEVTFVVLVALLSGGATGCAAACDPESVGLVVNGHARDAGQVTASGACRILHVCDAESSDAVCASFTVRSTGPGKCSIDVTFSDSAGAAHREIEFGPTADCCSDKCVSDGTPAQIRVE